jgi:hypothetical protein
MLKNQRAKKLRQRGQQPLIPPYAAFDAVDEQLRRRTAAVTVNAVGNILGLEYAALGTGIVGVPASRHAPHRAHVIQSAECDVVRQVRVVIGEAPKLRPVWSGHIGSEPDEVNGDVRRARVVNDLQPRGSSQQKLRQEKG